MGSDLAAAQHLVAGQAEYVRDELRHGVFADPQEDVLAVFDEEQAVPLELLRRQGQRRR